MKRKLGRHVFVGPLCRSLWYRIECQNTTDLATTGVGITLSHAMRAWQPASHIAQALRDTTRQRRRRT